MKAHCFSPLWLNLNKAKLTPMKITTLQKKKKKKKKEETLRNLSPELPALASSYGCIREYPTTHKLHWLALILKETSFRNKQTTTIFREQRKRDRRKEDLGLNQLPSEDVGFSRSWV